jgi:hypothetical protein
MWYDISKSLSYNKVFNFIVGNRGGGKTFSSKKWAINGFLKNKKQFIYVRRYKPELDKISKFFDDIKEFFPDHTLEVKGWKFYIDSKYCGEAIPLSVALRYKSTAFPMVDKIIYDEFIIDKGGIRYLPKEVECFLELFETIARTRDDVRAVFLANAISVVNPYFLYFKLKPNPLKQYNVYDDILIEFFKDEEFVENKYKTRFGRLVTGTLYGDYAIDNKFLRDDDKFIEQRPNDTQFSLAIKYAGKFYGFWIDWKCGIIYADEKYDPSSYNIYALQKDDHEPNMFLIKSLADSQPMKRIVFCFQNGYLRFSNMQVKNQFYEFIRFFQR